MKLPLKQTMRRAGAQFLGFLAALELLPEWWLVRLARHELYQTDYGFLFFATEWLLWSFVYDMWVLRDVNRP